MKLRVRWLQRLTILVGATVVAGLVLTLLVHTLMAAPGRREARRAREFRPPHLARGFPAVLKQLAIVTLVAVIGRKVFRIRLSNGGTK